ncbi:hypothetical protein [Novipirellula aureliae]|nr:hypothetical protein [Novipirellula aureliae]
MKPSQTAPLRSRRDLLLLGSALTAGGIFSVVAPLGLSYADDLRPQRLTVDGTRTMFRIRLETDATGNVNLPDNPLVSSKSTKMLPLKSAAVFDYEERLRRPERADTDSIVPAAERYFHEAQSESEVNRATIKCQLRQAVRSTIVRRETLPETTYCSEGFLSHEELDLLRMPVSSIAIEQLLPTDPVVQGDQYVIESESLESLLNLTAVDASEMKGEIVSLSAKEAKLQLRGDLDGSVDGVPTKIRVVGKMTFDRTLGVTTWLAMAIHETREISKAEPGFDVATTVKMLRKPIDQPNAMAKQPALIQFTSPPPVEQLYVEIRSDVLGFEALMDRRWRMMSDRPGHVMMRKIDHDRSIAQCDFRQLSALPAGRQWTIDSLQQDVRKTLGEQWREFVSSNQRVSDTGLNVMTLVARGAVQEVPIHWVIQHYQDDSGRRLLATFTMDGDSVNTFSGSDDQLASTLTMLERTSTAGRTEELAKKETLGDRTSDELGRISKKPIQSASDTK